MNVVLIKSPKCWPKVGAMSGLSGHDDKAMEMTAGCRSQRTCRKTL
jgi:hypothetical protein